MKVVRISVLLLLVAVVAVSGCKVVKEPVTPVEQIVPSEQVQEPSEQVVENGLEELQEIDSLEEKDDLGLEEIEQMELE